MSSVTDPENLIQGSWAPGTGPQTIRAAVPLRPKWWRLRARRAWSAAVAIEALDPYVAAVELGFRQGFAAGHQQGSEEVQRDALMVVGMFLRRFENPTTFSDQERTTIGGLVTQYEDPVTKGSTYEWHEQVDEAPLDAEFLG